MAKILEGKTLGAKIMEKLKAEVDDLSQKPALAIVQVGNKEESNLYIKKKKEFGEKAGFFVEHFQMPESISQSEIKKKIETLNKDSEINGIIIQLPLPESLNFLECVEFVNPMKDVDGLHSHNLKKLLAGAGKGFVPATAKGILGLLEFYNISPESKRVAVVGRSVLVGKPVFLLFSNQNATVTLCHSRTENLDEICRSADVIISAAGAPNLIKESFVTSGQVIVDVGINSVSGLKMWEEVSNKKIVGDVDFERVQKIVSAITPVPGGVGPMTVASLFENVLKAYKFQQNS